LSRIACFALTYLAARSCNRS